MQRNFHQEVFGLARGLLRGMVASQIPVLFANRILAKNCKVSGAKQIVQSNFCQLSYVLARSLLRGKVAAQLPAMSMIIQINQPNLIQTIQQAN